MTNHERLVKREVFSVNGNLVEVSSKTLKPSNIDGKKPHYGSIVFIPGWGVEAGSVSAK